MRRHQLRYLIERNYALGLSDFSYLILGLVRLRNIRKLLLRFLGRPCELVLAGSLGVDYAAYVAFVGFFFTLDVDCVVKSSERPHRIVAAYLPFLVLRLNFIRFFTFLGNN